MHTDRYRKREREREETKEEGEARAAADITVTCARVSAMTCPWARVGTREGEVRPEAPMTLSGITFILPLPPPGVPEV